MLSSRHDGSFHNAFLAKTPGRSVLKGRTGLRENATHHGSLTANAKGKKLHTPFQPSTLQSQRSFKQDQESKPTTRPLLDKTPFPNRVRNNLVTPLPHTNKQKYIFLDTPAPEIKGPQRTPRPSSTRRHSRIPRSASRSFETPATRGNPYDVSDISIDVADTIPVTGVANQSLVVEEDYDEIEYMPPTAVERPYEPPFDVPNYKEVGKTILRIAHSYHCDDSPPYDVDIDYDDDLLRASGFASSPSEWNTITLPPLEDEDPFGQAFLRKTVDRVQSNTVGQPSTTSTSRAKLTSRPTTRTMPSSSAPASSAVASRPRAGPATSTFNSTSKPMIRSVPSVRNPKAGSLVSRSVATSSRSTSATTSRIGSTTSRTTSRVTAPSTRAPISAPSRTAATKTTTRPATSVSVQKSKPLVGGKAQKIEDPDVVLVFSTQVDEDAMDDFKFNV